MHTCYLLAHSPKMQQLLTPFRIFTVIFSGLCHDVGHTGFTNLFEIASHSRKAITYNDNSVLVVLFSLLKTTMQPRRSNCCGSQRTTS